MGEMIEFGANGGTLSGYLATPPAGKGNGRGVVVLQEWWGLVPHIEDLVDRFAAAGYVAMSPDLYRGEKTTKPDEAGRMLMALNVAQAEKDLRGAVRALKARDDVGQVGVVGFCMGGKLALFAATVSDEVAACVDFYGIHPKIEPDFSKLSCPVLGLFGAKDDMVTTDKVDELVAKIEAAGASIERHDYPDAGHAFFNDTRPEAYDAAAAQDAWKRTLAFFDAHL